MMLQVGKTYNHSASGAQNPWKIIEAWSEDLFEGIHVGGYGTIDPDVASKVMFNAAGVPIGCRGKRFYSPNGWYLVEPDTYEYKIIFGDDSGTSYEWKPLRPFSDGGWYPENAHYIIRKNKNMKALQLMNHSQFKSLVNKEFPK